jgi:sec-independent protein translocase protein TatA
MNIAFLPNLAGPDGIFILVIILMFFGAKKLPELAKGMGQAVREFSKAKDEVEHEITRPAAPAPPQRIEEVKVESAKETHADDPAHHETTHQV